MADVQDQAATVRNDTVDAATGIGRATALGIGMSVAAT